MTITLPDPTMARLETLAEQRGEPASRIAAQMVCAGLAEGKDPRRDDSSISASSPATAPDRNAPWIEPVLGDPEWRSYMWGSIVALYGRYPTAGAPERRLEEDAAHVEVLCALVVWRDWIDQVARTRGTNWRFMRSSPTTAENFARKAAASRGHGSPAPRPTGGPVDR